jgi:hypothetical protein
VNAPVNQFWSTLKSLEGRTVKSVEENLVPCEETVGGLAADGFVVVCEDGHRVTVRLDFEDFELVAE